MLGPGDILTIISICVLVLFDIWTTSRAAKVDNSEAGKNGGIIASDLGYLKRGIDEVNHRLEVQDQRFIEIFQRLSAVESSAKQAHHRIDEFAGSNRPEEAGRKDK